MRNRNHKNFVIVIITLIFCGSCCNLDSPTVNNWDSGYIKKFGRYISSDKSIVISVSNNNGLLHYDIEKKRQTILASKENASIYQNWILYWDKNQNLWVRSSDIGDWVWCKGSTGVYEKYSFEQRPRNCSPIPNEFLNNL